MTSEEARRKLFLEFMHCSNVLMPMFGDQGVFFSEVIHAWAALRFSGRVAGPDDYTRGELEFDLKEAAEPVECWGGLIEAYVERARKEQEDELRGEVWIAAEDVVGVRPYPVER